MFLRFTTGSFDTYYRLPTRLQESNVFSRVSLLMGEGAESYVTIIHNAFDLTVHVPRSPGHGILLYSHSLLFPWKWDLTAQGPPVSDIWWPSLKTCSSLLTSGPLPLQVLTSGDY